MKRINNSTASLVKWFPIPHKYAEWEPISSTLTWIAFEKSVCSEMSFFKLHSTPLRIFIYTWYLETKQCNCFVLDSLSQHERKKQKTGKSCIQQFLCVCSHLRLYWAVVEFVNFNLTKYVTMFFESISMNLSII